MSNTNERNMEYRIPDQGIDDRIDLIALLINMWKGFQKFWIRLFLVALVCAGVFFLIHKVTYQPRYEASATFSVESDTTGSSTYNSIDPEELKDTIPQLLNSQVLKDLIMDDLQLDWFNFEFSLESQSTVALYTLTVSGDNAQDVHNVLNAALSNLPMIGEYVFGSIELNIMDESGVPAIPSNYISVPKALVLGFAGGIVLDCLFLFLYAFRYESILSEEDLKKHLNVRCLASVPAVRFKRRNKKVDQHIHIYNPLIPPQFSESFRKISGRIERESYKHGRKTIMITSSIPGEGKSTVAINLGMSLAKKGKKVVVVDCDFRNPSTGDIIGLDEMSMPNMLDAIHGSFPISDVIQHYEEWNLDVVFTGTVSSNPMAEINMQKLKAFLEKLEEQYDFVILDTSPAAMLADASNFAQFVDGIVYIVCYDSVSIRQIREGINAIAMSHKPIYGCIINRAEGSYVSYHHYYYGKKR